MRQAIPVTLSRTDRLDRAAFAWAVRSQFEALAADAATILHPRELTTFRGLEVDRRRRSYLLGRAVAKHALRACRPDAVPSAIDIAPGVFQFPVVQPSFADPLGVSLTHSDRLACALAFPEGHPLGIDAEDLSTDRSTVMQSQMVPDELARAGAAWPDVSCHAAVLWTAKEALSKVLRCGLTCPFPLLAVTALSRDGAVLTGEFANFTQYKFQTWLGDRTVISIVLPRHTTMRLDLQPLLHALAQEPS